MFPKSLALILFLPLLSAVSADGPYCLTNNTIFTAGAEQYALTTIIETLNLPLNQLLGWTLDGPAIFSEAPTTTNVQDFTIEELKYYNYISSSMYCAFTLPTLTCCLCGMYNSTVTEHKIFETMIQGTKTLVTLHPSKQEIVVAYRGSYSPMNWAMDFAMVTSHSNGQVKIHHGFYLQTMAAYNQVTQYVYTLLENNPGFHIVLTGHSLGGAQATILTYFWTYLNQFPGTELRLVTYGAPRVGNKGFADFMNALNIKAARVVARADLAPHIIPVSPFPLPLLSEHYLHVMREIWINGQNTVYCSKTKYEDPSCSNSMGPAYSFPDHLVYFDVDIVYCFADYENGGEVLTQNGFVNLPEGWTPDLYSPPIPTKIAKTLEGLWAGGYGGVVYPLVG